MILSLSDNANNGMMMLLLVLCATVIMIVLLRRHQFRGATQRDLGREQLARVRDQRNLHRSMDELLLQLEDLSRRVGAQVDTKFTKLETVIRDADDRLARLEHVLGKLKHGSRPPCAAADLKRKPPMTVTVAKPPPSAKALPADTEERPPAKPADPRSQRVYELVDAGASPLEAAEEVELPLGEVELILSLRKLD